MRECRSPVSLRSSGLQFLKLQIPVFADNGFAEAHALLAAGEREARFLIDVPRRGEHAVRPQRHFLVAGAAGKAGAFIDQPRPEPKPARLRIDDQQSDAGNIGRVGDQKNAADIFAVQLGDPAAFALRIVLVGKIGDDLRADAFERFDPAVFLRVKFGVALDDPAEIAGPRRAQDVALLGRRRGLYFAAAFDRPAASGSSSSRRSAGTGRPGDSLPSMAPISCCERRSSGA